MIKQAVIKYSDTALIFIKGKLEFYIGRKHWAAIKSAMDMGKKNLRGQIVLDSDDKDNS